jgi:hypothetical protein
MLQHFLFHGFNFKYKIKLMKTRFNVFIAVIAFMVIISGCTKTETGVKALTEAEKQGLLFMLEEEKLARDTYTYLDGVWSVSQFANIKNSEQSHMNAIENLLNKYAVTYTILPYGEFANQDLQDLYDQFITDGQADIVSALKIGATIEDLDIVDLKVRIDQTDKTDIIAVYQKLTCGSRNHLRSYVSALVTEGFTYVPQFLNIEDYNIIINGSHEQCN